MQEWKIGEAYIQFATKGDVTSDIDRVTGQAKDAQTELDQTAKDRDKAARERQQRMNKIAGLGGEAFGRLPGVGAAERLYQTYTHAQAEQEKVKSPTERFAGYTTQTAQERIVERGTSAAIMKTTGKQAGGTAQAGAASAPAGAEAAAAGLSARALTGLTAAAMFASYAIKGVGISSPATMERLNYQTDRLQGIIGQKAAPAVNWFANQVEKVGDFLGGKGAQIAAPQFSDFASVRDRVQIEALRSIPESGRQPLKESFKAKATMAQYLGLSSDSDLVHENKNLLGGRGKDLSEQLGDLYKHRDDGQSWTERNFPNLVAGYRSVVSIFDE